MRPFRYERPENQAGAVSLLATPNSQLLAGGTNLVDLLKLGVSSSEVLIDINRVDFGGIDARADGGVRVGAGVRGADLAADRIVRTRFPLLSEALLSAASGQLRNMASTGGNLLQRTRCVYFMDTTKPCNKRDPGSGCPAIVGASRELAILGGSSSCIATHPGDMAVALAALDAEVHYLTRQGAASMPLLDFYRLPGDQPQLDTNLPAEAMITAVEIPGLPFGAVSTYRKARDRRSYAFGLVTVAAALDVEDGVVRDLRLALGGVSARPWRARVAEDQLRGGEANPANFEAAAVAELLGATPTEQNAFKIPLAIRMITGVLEELSRR